MKAKIKLPPLILTPVKLGGTAATGAGMLNPVDVAQVNPVEVKEMVAPVTAAALVAVRPAKEAEPETAACVAVPPIVQAPAPTWATMFDVAVVIRLPYWS